MPAFMEQSISNSDFVLVICTPGYRERSDGRIGGVGYEGHIITSEIFGRGNHEKFIPILRRGTWGEGNPPTRRPRRSVAGTISTYLARHIRRKNT